MIKAESIEGLSEMLTKASEKAAKEMPEIVIIEKGHYKVQSSSGNFYDVFTGITPEGMFFIACTCKANLEGKACYHSARAFAKHITLAIQAKAESVNSEVVSQRHVMKGDSEDFNGMRV